MKNQLRLKLQTLFLLFFLGFLPSTLLAQQIEVSGTVAGQEDGLPLPGVTILVQGTNTGTTTDFDGYYSINVNI